MKSFKDLQEAIGGIVTDHIGPQDLANIKEFARKASNSGQASIPRFLEMLENELNKFAFTLGQLDLTDGFEDEDEEDFFILTFATKEIVKNAYITIAWSKMNQTVIFPYSLDGAGLKYEVQVEISEVTPEDMEAIIDANLDDGEDADEINGDDDGDEIPARKDSDDNFGQNQ